MWLAPSPSPHKGARASRQDWPGRRHISPFPASPPLALHRHHHSDMRHPHPHQRHLQPQKGRQGRPRHSQHAHHPRRLWHLAIRTCRRVIPHYLSYYRRRAHSLVQDGTASAQLVPLPRVPSVLLCSHAYRSTRRQTPPD